MTWTWPWNTVIPDTPGEFARLLANETARSVKPRPIPPTRETERHEMDAHMKKVFGADQTTNTGNIQDHAPPYQCDLREIHRRNDSVQSL